jgi:TRAP-type C4-dicarboxylate transport system permease large subunit
VRSVVRPLWPMYLAMVAALVVVTFVPGLSLWLPRLADR